MAINPKAEVDYSVWDFILGRSRPENLPGTGENVFRSYRITEDLPSNVQPVFVTNDIRVEPAMAIRTGQLTLVANVALQVAPANPFRRRFRFRNLTATLQYFMGQDETVTIGNGFPIDVNGNPSDELVMPYTGEIWIVSSGACTIAWMEES